jgi:hypothetical protein
MAHTACLICFISTVNGCGNKKKKRKEEAYPWKTGISSVHITNLKQSIFETFDIYECNPETWPLFSQQSIFFATYELAQ